LQHDSGRSAADRRRRHQLRAYKETNFSLHDSDKNCLLGCDHYKSGRIVVKPSPWAESDFEEKMATLLRLANTLNRSVPALTEAQKLLEDEDSIIGRVIRRSKTNDLPSLEPQEKELPRWVRVPVGSALGLFTLFCGVASLSLLIVPNKQSPVLAVIIGLVLILGCLWVLEKCFRLITGRQNRGGLMSPNALRVVSIFLLMLPSAGLFTGYYREGALAIFQAMMYFSPFWGFVSWLGNEKPSDIPNLSRFGAS
jgi:hypothetical protein